MQLNEIFWRLVEMTARSFDRKSRQFGNVYVLVIRTVVPLDVTAVDRVPREAVPFRFVPRGKQDWTKSPAINQAQKEAPVVVGAEVKRIFVHLAESLQSFGLVAVDVGLDARLALGDQLGVPQGQAAEK